MRKLLFVLLTCCVAFTSNAQEDKVLKELEEKGLFFGKMKADCRVTIENKGKVLLLKDSVQLGDSLTVTVAWQNGLMEKILLEGEYAYKPTPKEFEKGIYTFSFKPKRTFSFKYPPDFKDKNRKSWSTLRVVRVVDKNGQEIKGVDPTEMKRN